MKLLNHIIVFYKALAIPTLLVTMICTFYIHRFGISSFMPLFWFKLATTACILYYINSNKKNEFYYYMNLGISKHKLYILTLFVDISIFIIAILTN